MGTATRIGSSRVADRLDTFGTWLPEPDSPAYIWVGSPLRVHRRCDQLMFEVSNKIAYDNMDWCMASPPTRPFELLAQSTWLDVGAHPAGSKWNPAEGRYVIARLDTVRNRIAQKMNEEVADAGTGLPEWAASDREREIEFNRRVADAVSLSARSATSSTTCGKSSATDSPRKPAGGEPSIPRRARKLHRHPCPRNCHNQARSRKWASQTPNLLNVAVTRARPTRRDRGLP